MNAVLPILVLFLLRVVIPVSLVLALGEWYARHERQILYHF